MTRVVINTCFGGFSLSDAAVLRYAELKGLTLYPERDGMICLWWMVPAELRAGYLSGEAWLNASREEQEASSALWDSFVLDDMTISRDDPLLVRVVEELGDAADGSYADLRIVEIPDDVKWEIKEYDGSEHVAETHRTWG